MKACENIGWVNVKKLELAVGRPPSTPSGFFERYIDIVKGSDNMRVECKYWKDIEFKPLDKINEYLIQMQFDFNRLNQEGAIFEHWFCQSSGVRHQADLEYQIKTILTDPKFINNKVNGIPIYQNLIGTGPNQFETIDLLISSKFKCKYFQ